MNERRYIYPECFTKQSSGGHQSKRKEKIYLHPALMMRFIYAREYMTLMLSRKKK
jgi:hypothetical protein